MLLTVAPSPRRYIATPPGGWPQLQARGVTPRLIFVRVGEDPASRVYVGMKEKMAARLGILSQTQVLAAETSESELLDLVGRLNADSSVHGILVQAPLPKHISETTVYGAVSLREGRGWFSSRQCGQIDAGRSDRLSPMHAGGHSRVADPLRRKDRRARKRSCWGGAISSASRWRRCCCRKTKHAGATVTVCHSQTRDIGGALPPGGYFDRGDGRGRSLSKPTWSSPARW